MKLFASKSSARGEKGWLEQFVRDRAGDMALVKDRVGHEEFLQFCIDAAPPTSPRRDTRKQAFVRTMRRMQERGDLPFRVEADCFVLE
jgi:hypothetical protein